ncbi:MAG: HIT family protein [Saprospiraceae bacterium]|nr:HIT family protein [Saprospiraceae bacterium]
MASIFTRIIKAEIPSFKIAENEHCFAFLDVKPLVRGHVLVVPKHEVDYLFDLSKEEYHELMEFSRTLSISIKNVIPCIKIGVAVVGLEVPHAHVHLVPLQQISDLNFSNPRADIGELEMREIADKISADFNHQRIVE